MADYDEGSVLENDKGERITLKNGAWVPVPTWGQTGVDAAKSFGSGVLHEGVPSVLGLPADAASLVAAAPGAGKWAGDKFRSLFAKPAEEGAASVEAPTDTTPIKMPSTILTAPIDAVRNIAGGAAKAGFKVPEVLKNPGSENIRSAISSVVPEHVPETTTGEFAKTAGSFLPGALAGPAGGARQVAGSLLRYGIAPGLASEAAGQVVKQVAGENSPYEAPARIAASLLSPNVARKVMTPNAAQGATPGAVAEHLRLAEQLPAEHGITSVTPGQISNNPVAQAREASRANTSGSGTTAAYENERQARDVTGAAFQHAGTPVTDAEIGTPQAMHRLRADTDAEMNRVTSQPGNAMAWTTNRNALPRALEAHVTHYEQNALEPPGTGPRELLNHVDNVVNNTHGGILNGRTYQDLRSILGRRMSEAGGHDERTMYGNMQNELDRAMEHSISIHNPADLGAFHQARQNWLSRMVLEHAMDGKTNLIPPDRLLSSVEHFTGGRTSVPDAHPLGRLAKAAGTVLKPLSEGEKGTKLFNDPSLALILGGGALGAGALAANQNGHDNLGTLGGGLAGSLAAGAWPKIAASLMLRRGMRPYLTNQAHPPIPLANDRARQLLLARSLIEGGGGEPAKAP